MLRTITVCDDFLRNPQALLREFSGIGNSMPVDNSPLKMTRRSKHARAVTRKIESLFGTRFDWKWSAGSGTYRWCTEGEIRKSGYQCNVHSDTYSGKVFMLYLNRPNECHGGTGLYRHKLTELDSPMDLEAVRKVLNRFNWSVEDLRKRIAMDAFDIRKWTLTDRIEMRFNRLLAFNAFRFHSHILDFKGAKTRNTKRLFLTNYAD